MGDKKAPTPIFDPWEVESPHKVFIGTASSSDIDADLFGPSPSSDKSTLSEASPEPCFRFRFPVAEYESEFGSPYGKGWATLPGNLGEIARKYGETPPAFLDAVICYPKGKPDALELLGWDSAEARTAWSEAFTPFEDADAS